MEPQKAAPISAVRARQPGIIAAPLAAPTHSRSVQNIVWQAEHTRLHRNVLHLSDDGWGEGEEEEEEEEKATEGCMVTFSM